MQAFRAIWRPESRPAASIPGGRRQTFVIRNDETLSLLLDPGSGTAGGLRPSTCPPDREPRSFANGDAARYRDDHALADAFADGLSDA